MILIGVDDHGDIVCLDQQNLNQAEKTVVEICRDSIEPQVRVVTEKLQLDDKSLLKIEVPRGLFIYRTSGGYFIRQGSGKREMPKEYLARLLQSRSRVGIISFDKQSVSNTTRGTLRRDLYLRFFTEEPADHEVEDLLLMRNLLVREGSELRASVAGLYCCAMTDLMTTFTTALFRLSSIAAQKKTRTTRLMPKISEGH